MYGLIFDGVEQWVLLSASKKLVETDGSEVWNLILRSAAAILLDSGLIHYSVGGPRHCVHASEEDDAVIADQDYRANDIATIHSIIDQNDCHFVTNQRYSDEIFFAIVEAASQELKITSDEVLEACGYFFIEYIRQKDGGSYENVLACQGNSLREWVSYASDFHAHLGQSLQGKAEFSFPEIFCTTDSISTGSRMRSAGEEKYSEEKWNDQPLATTTTSSSSSSSFILHYRSVRVSFLSPFLIGIVRRAAADYFNSQLIVDPLTKQDSFEGGVRHSTWRIKMLTTASSNDSSTNDADDANGGVVGMSARALKTAFPFHIALDRELRISQIGIGLEKRLNDTLGVSVIGSRIDDHFTMNLPSSFHGNNDDDQRLTWDDIYQRKDALFDFSVTERPKLFRLSGSVVPDGKMPEGGPREGEPSTLIFLLQPNITSMDDMVEHTLTWSDFGRHSSQQKLIMLTEHLKRETNQTINSKRDVELSKLSLEMKRIFVRYVSHEIRTPLNTVSMGLELIKHSLLRRIADGANSPNPRFAAAHHPQLPTPVRARKDSSSSQRQGYSSAASTDERGINGSGSETPSRRRLSGAMVRSMVTRLLSVGGREDPFALPNSGSSMHSTGGEGGGGGERGGAAALDLNVADMVDQVKDSCDIAINILNDLLIYEKLEGEVSLLHKNREPLLPIVLDVANSFRIQARHAGLRIELTTDSATLSVEEVENPTVFVNVDKSKISHALRNLVSNAIKYSRQPNTLATSPHQDLLSAVNRHISVSASRPCTPALKSGVGTPVIRDDDKITIHVSVISPGDSSDISSSLIETTDALLSSVVDAAAFVRIEVIDCGPGLSPEDKQILLRNIVDFDLNELQGGGGSGLGLYISKGIMDLHGGRIGIHSVGKGNGTTFFLDIPVLNTEECAIGEEEEEDCYPASVTAATAAALGESMNGSSFLSTGSRSSGSHHMPSSLSRQQSSLHSAAATTASLTRTTSFLVSAITGHGMISTSPRFKSSSAQLRHTSSSGGGGGGGDDSFLPSAVALQRERASASGSVLPSPSATPLPMINPSRSNRHSASCTPVTATGPGRNTTTGNTPRLSTTAITSSAGGSGSQTPSSATHYYQQPHTTSSSTAPSPSSAVSTIGGGGGFGVSTRSHTPAAAPAVRVELGTRKASAATTSMLDPQRTMTMRDQHAPSASSTSNSFPRQSGSRQSPSSDFYVSLSLSPRGGVRTSVCVGGGGFGPLNDDDIEDELLLSESSNNSGSDTSSLRSSVAMVFSKSPTGTAAAGVAVAGGGRGEEDQLSNRSSPVRAKKNRKYRILVVDDAASSRKMVVRYLRVAKIGQIVKEAADGEEAVRIYEKSIRTEEEAGHRSGFDCILMDFVMPVMDGPTATKRIRELGFAGPIIGITGNVLPEDIRLFKNAGANDVMGKPLEMERLRGIIETYVNENSPSVSVQPRMAGDKTPPTNLVSPSRATTVTNRGGGNSGGGGNHGLHRVTEQKDDEEDDDLCIGGGASSGISLSSSLDIISSVIDDSNVVHDVAAVSTADSVVGLAKEDDINSHSGRVAGGDDENLRYTVVVLNHLEEKQQQQQQQDNMQNLEAGLTSTAFFGDEKNDDGGDDDYGDSLANTFLPSPLTHMMSATSTVATISPHLLPPDDATHAGTHHSATTAEVLHNLSRRSTLGEGKAASPAHEENKNNSNNNNTINSNSYHGTNNASNTPPAGAGSFWNRRGGLSRLGSNDNHSNFPTPRLLIPGGANDPQGRRPSAPQLSGGGIGGRIASVHGRLLNVVVNDSQVVAGHASAIDRPAQQILQQHSLFGTSFSGVGGRHNRVAAAAVGRTSPATAVAAAGATTATTVTTTQRGVNGSVAHEQQLQQQQQQQQQSTTTTGSSATMMQRAFSSISQALGASASAAAFRRSSPEGASGVPLDDPSSYYFNPSSIRPADPASIHHHHQQQQQEQQHGQPRSGLVLSSQMDSFTGNQAAAAMIAMHQHQQQRLSPRINDSPSHRRILALGGGAGGSSQRQLGGTGIGDHSSSTGTGGGLSERTTNVVSVRAVQPLRGHDSAAARAAPPSNQRGREGGREEGGASAAAGAAAGGAAVSGRRGEGSSLSPTRATTGTAIVSFIQRTVLGYFPTSSSSSRRDNAQVAPVLP